MPRAGIEPATLREHLSAAEHTVRQQRFTCDAYSALGESVLFAQLEPSSRVRGSSKKRNKKTF